jgi:hypothetical protein
MDFPGNGGPLYQVYCSGAVAESIREVHQQATREGRGQAMVDAFRRAVERLRQEPKKFGEGLYRLPALRMQVRTALIRPLALDFAVCLDRPLVFIKGVTLLSE